MLNQIKLNASKLLAGTLIICSTISTLTACQTTNPSPKTPPTQSGIKVPHPTTNPAAPKSTSKKNLLDPTTSQTQTNQPAQDHTEHTSKPASTSNSKDTQNPSTQTEATEQTDQPASQPKTQTNQNEPTKEQPTTEKIDPAERQKIFLEKARQKRASQSTQKTTQKHNKPASLPPAFNKLINQGLIHLKNNQLNDAQHAFTQAQRLAPQSDRAYYYLAQIALKKNQPKKAESLARRGLSFVQENIQSKNFWQIILKSAQIQGKTEVIEEAINAIKTP